MLKSQSQKVTICDPIHLIFFKKTQNYCVGEQISGYQRLRRGGSGRIVSVDIKGQHEGFLG